MSHCGATLHLNPPPPNGRYPQVCGKSAPHVGEPHYCDGYAWTDDGSPPVALDVVNHPPHYKTAAGIEAIDVIEAFELNYRLGAVAKYILRHAKKGRPLEDLKKARWYLDREISRREGGAK